MNPRLSKIAMVAAVAAALTAGPVALASSASAAPASARTVTPQFTERNIYETESGCDWAGFWGQLWDNWDEYFCDPIDLPGDDEPWWQLLTDP